MIKEFSSITSFIVVTGRDSLLSGFKARNSGAFAAILKPVNFEDLSIFNLINDAFLQSIFKKVACENNKSVIVDAVKILMSRKPADMKAWIEMLNIDEGYLRKIWKRYFEYQPRQLLVLFNTLLKAFEYYTGLYCKELGLKNNIERLLPKDFEYVKNRFKTVYQNHQKEIDVIMKGKI